MNERTATDYFEKTFVARLRDWTRQNPEATATMLFGILSIVVAYNIFFLGREVKSLRVTILSNASLVEIEQSVAKDITVLYKDQPVDNLSLVTVKLENTGNQAIREDEYARPIGFIFPESANILDAVVLETHPSNIGITLLKEQNVVTLPPVLLNEGDSGVFQFLVINTPFGVRSSSPPFTIDARIAGAKDIKVVSAIKGRSPAEQISVLSVVPFVLLVIILTLFILSLAVYFRARKIRAEVARLLNESLNELGRGLAPRTPEATFHEPPGQRVSDSGD